MVGKIVKKPDEYLASTMAELNKLTLQQALI